MRRLLTCLNDDTDALRFSARRGASRAGGGASPALRFKALPGDVAWAGVLPLDGVSVGALALGDGHPTAACFCARPATPRQGVR